MKTNDFNQNLTSKKLKENLEKQFGASVNLSKYSRLQLEDIRNKLRTRVFQQENDAGINDLLTNETYQKDQAMLQLLNTRIKEMLGENIKQLRDKMDQLSEGSKAKKDYDGDGKIETSKEEHAGSVDKAIKKSMRKPAKETDLAEAMPSIGMPANAKSAVTKKAPAEKVASKPVMISKKTEKPAAKKSTKMESDNSFRNNVRMVNEGLGRFLLEDEEAKAKAITAAGDMVNDFTSWMQRVGQYQTKSMIELADAIKADFGAEQAEAFKAVVGPALTSALDTLTTQREAISNAVASLASGEAPPMGMGQDPMMEPGLDTEPGMEQPAPDGLNGEPEDEFSASDAAAGSGTTGREMRESANQRRARKLAESHSVMSKLAK